MFGKERSPTLATRINGKQQSGGITILTSGCHFNGKLICRGATRIGGQVEGQIIAEGLLIIEQDAIVNGDIVAEEMMIHGEVIGIIEVKKKCELSSTARVQADIQTNSLVIHQGAIFNGRSEMKVSLTAGHSLPQMSHIEKDFKNDAQFLT